ncbi:hypothetical protein [Companilactobacillus tucceti]|nr:hypothetical protein [Companilactobacillus tucceti]
MKNIMLKGLIIIVALVLIILGLVMWTTNTNRRMNINDFSISRLTDRKYALSSNLDSISVTTRTSKVKIVSGDALKLSLKNVSDDQYKVINDNHKLTIVQKNSSTHNLEIGKSSEITITVPDNLKRIKINQLNGTLNLKDLEVENLAIDHQNGSTIADNLKIDDRGTITKKNGKTSLDGVNVNGLSVSIKNGGFTLNGVKKISSNKTYNDHKNHQLKINSGSGQVVVKTK